MDDQLGPRDPEFALDDSFKDLGQTYLRTLRACEAAGRRGGGQIDTTQENLAMRAVAAAMASLQGVLNGAARKPQPVGLSLDDIHAIGYNTASLLFSMHPGGPGEQENTAALEAVASGVGSALDELIARHGGPGPDAPAAAPPQGRPAARSEASEAERKRGTDGPDGPEDR